MDDAILRQRVEAARVGHLATTRPDGRPHVVPCCFVLTGDVVYSAVDAKPKSTLALQRLRNLAVHPAASLVVDHYEEEWTQLWWVRLDGVARVLESGTERDSRARDARREVPAVCRRTAAGRGGRDRRDGAALMAVTT